MSTVETIAGYRIVETIKQGGMSVVYKASGISAGYYALKVYPLSPKKQERYLHRYNREVSFLTKLDHPNIVRLIGYDETEEYCYLVMPYYPNQSMLQTPPQFTPSRGGVVNNTAPIIQGAAPSIQDAGSIKEALRFVLRLLDGLLYLAQNNIVHSDLKPSNILLADGNIPIITDFGNGKQLSPGNNKLTQQGFGVGTLLYMAPEQARGDWTITSKADVYSTGVILYELLTRTKPYRADSIEMLIDRQSKSKPVQPNTLNTGLDRYVNFLVLKMLETDPDERPDVEETMQMFQFALQ